MHPHVLKIQLLSGVVQRMDFEASCRLLADYHDSHLSQWFTFAKSDSQYGGFKPPALRHMMAERACRDTVFYREALADPAAALPTFFAWLRASRPRDGVETMTAGKQTQYKAMVRAFLEAAQAAHLKWNGSTWTRAHHLLGVLCLEERRRWFAAELLVLLKAEAVLDEALVSAALVGAAARGEAPPPRAADLRAAPRDAVDRVLLEHVHARARRHAACGAEGVADGYPSSAARASPAGFYAAAHDSCRPSTLAETNALTVPRDAAALRGLRARAADRVDGLAARDRGEGAPARALHCALPPVHAQVSADAPS